MFLLICHKHFKICPLLANHDNTFWARLGHHDIIRLTMCRRRSVFFSLSYSFHNSCHVGWKIVLLYLDVKILLTWAFITMYAISIINISAVKWYSFLLIGKPYWCEFLEFLANRKWDYTERLAKETSVNWSINGIANMELIIWQLASRYRNAQFRTNIGLLWAILAVNRNSNLAERHRPAASESSTAEISRICRFYINNTVYIIHPKTAEIWWSSKGKSRNTLDIPPLMSLSSKLATIRSFCERYTCAHVTEENHQTKFIATCLCYTLRRIRIASTLKR